MLVPTAQARPIFLGQTATALLSQEVLVRVRAVRAQQPIPTEQITRHRTAAIPAELRDLEPKLMRLPFQSFTLLSSASQQLPFNKRGEMQLADGHQLSFKPLQERDKRVCLWLEWRDGGKMEVLNTRLHFNYGESMLTGMEASADTGIILAVDVEPAARP